MLFETKMSHLDKNVCITEKVFTIDVSVVNLYQRAMWNVEL